MDAARPHLPPNMGWGGLPLPWKEDDGVGGAACQESIPGQHPYLSSAPFGKQCYFPYPEKNHLLSSLSTSATPASWWGFFFPSLDARFSALFRASCCPSPHQQAGGELCSHEQLCLTSGGRGFLSKDCWVGSIMPFIVTLEVLLNLERDDRTDVKLSFS